MPSRFIPIPYGTDPAQQLAMINKNFGELDNENVTKIFYDINGTPSIAIGVQQDRTSRIKVATAGFDVTSATAEQLAFDSANITFRVGATDVVDVTRSASVDTGSVDVSTGSLSAPLFVCSVYNPASSPAFKFETPHFAYNTAGADSGKVTNQQTAFYDPSTGVIRFQVIATSIAGNFASVESWRFRYYLLYVTNT